jgi:DNA-binding IclR family transcriptional regulator
MYTTASLRRGGRSVEDTRILDELGYVERYGREFRPLERLRRLGGTMTKRDRLARLAQPLLARARDELKESVSLAVLESIRLFAKEVLTRFGGSSRSP